MEYGLIGLIMALKSHKPIGTREFNIKALILFLILDMKLHTRMEKKAPDSIMILMII